MTGHHAKTQTRIVNADEKYRKCLSGIGIGHFFLSPSAGVRICPRCTGKRKNQTALEMKTSRVTDPM